MQMRGNTYNALAIYLQFTCNATVMHLQYTSEAPVMHLRCTHNAPEMHPQCTCNAPAMHLQCTCNAPAMQPQCICNTTAMQLQCQDRQVRFFGKRPIQYNTTTIQQNDKHRIMRRLVVATLLVERGFSEKTKF